MERVSTRKVLAKGCEAMIGRGNVGAGTVGSEPSLSMGVRDQVRVWECGEEWGKARVDNAKLGQGRHR